ncbi:molybdenum cofactor guanylyltransferase [Arthrobacter sp. TMN-49]
MQAVILAGGLSRRLGGVPKAGLVVDGKTLLARTVEAAAQAITAAETAHPASTQGAAGAQPSIAVVGPVESVAAWLGTAKLREQVVAVQEDPPFAGPAAGIAAGLAALPAREGRVLILACDMPAAATVARLLLAADGFSAPEAVLAVDRGRLQPLAGIYPVPELLAAVAAARTSQRLANASVRSLIASVSIKECVVPEGITADIDTWDDARSHGIGVRGCEQE